ncbi:hypothetical protein J2Y55_002121 [Bosea sp. BE125]|uniref:hypothetical protein n=1 Tax=Bosea sp. BE125 TaxID=2817909 RepID=UPI002855E11A|nr:hypothetical protein [Bosea sp. BE125]MDR6871113.1 hypothetical protein [Bosea sp. BE125]
MLRQLTAGTMIASMLCSTAIAETSTQKMVDDPKSNYFFIKKYLKSDQRINSLMPSGTDIDINDDRRTLMTCSDTTLAFGQQKKIKSTNLINFAFEMLYMEAMLKTTGYPTSTWASKISAYERDSIIAVSLSRKMVDNRNGNSFTKRLAAELNDYRRKNNRRLPVILPTATECGDGEIDVKIVTDPKAIRVQFINKIYFDLCKFQKLDASKPSECDHYTDYASEKDGIYMAGRYKVLVTWTNSSKIFDMDVDNLRDGGAGTRIWRVSQ